MNSQYKVTYTTVFQDGIQATYKEWGIEGKTIGQTYLCSLCKNGFYIYKSMLGEQIIFTGRMYFQKNKCRECKRISRYVESS